MSNGLIAMFFALGAAGWTYSMLARNTGNATPSTNFKGAGIVGVIAFLFIYSLLKYILHF